MASHPPAAPRFEVKPAPELDDAPPPMRLVSVLTAIILSVPLWIAIGVLLAAVWP